VRPFLQIAQCTSHCSSLHLAGDQNSRISIGELLALADRQAEILLAFLPHQEKTT